jgi:VanZ family protein
VILDPFGMTSQRPRWAWLFFAQLALLVGASVLAAQGRLPRTVFSSGFDKLGHFLGLGLLSFLAVAFFGRARWVRTVLVLAAVSILEELSQAWFPARTVDVRDLVANLAGIVVFGGAIGLTSEI